MLSMTGEYALRAMIYLAQHEDEWPVAGNLIAAKGGIPAKYLSKIPGDLVRAGVLTSSRGLGGGFRMVRSPNSTWLYDVLAPFESFDNRRCPFGNKKCSEETPCLAHDRWKIVVEAQQRFLDRTSVLDIAVPKAKRAKARSKKKTKR